MSVSVGLIALFSVTSANLQLYVSSNGADANNRNCSKQKPCGTLYWSSYVRHNHEPFNLSNDVEIIINGINYNNVSYWGSHSVDCSCLPIIITLPLTFTFNISSEWLELAACNEECFTSQYLIKGELPFNDDKLVINNWVVSDTFQTEWITSFIQLTIGTVILNNCTFEHLQIWSSLWSFDVYSIEIYDCNFYDILVNQERWNQEHIGEFMIGFIYVTHGYFIMNNLNVSDIRMWWTHFIFGEGIKDGTISNSSFHTTQFKPEYAQTYSLIYMQHVHLNTFDKLIINNSSFENIISGGVLNIGIGTHGNIIFANNIITTSHLWSQALAYNDIALIMVTETAKLTMDNISLTYVWMDKIDEVCNIWKRDVPITGQNYIDVYCQVPYRFIRSAGLIVMNDIYITNDLNQNGLYDFRDRYLLLTNITSIENISSVGIHFEPDIYSYANAIIYNDRGQLVMDSILIYGVALHVSVLYNTGIAFVSDLNLSHPNYYYNNSDKINVKTLIEVIYNVGVHSGLTDEQCKNNNECYSDHINLELTNGVIIIDNSNINGGVIGIYDHSGYIELYETVISNVLISIYAWNSVSVKIKFCDFNNIGHYHKADFISLCWVYNMGRWMDHSMFFWNVKNISIAHNIFNYFPLTDYIFFWNGDRLRETNAIITDNDFMNPITSNTFTTHHFEPFALIGIKYNGWISNLNESKYHLVNFKGYWNLIKFINNIFYPNDIISISNKTACLFIDDYNWIVTNESYNCISGNIFHGIAVQINSGILTSCIHPQLSFHNRNNNTYCW
eukprot:391510_1